MLYIFWEFQVHPDKITEFERRYGTEGDWAMLFRSAAGYEKTVLGRDRNSAGHYLVTDVWDSEASSNAFKKKFRDAYEALDKQCESLTLTEKHFGDFDIV